MVKKRSSACERERGGEVREKRRKETEKKHHRIHVFIYAYRKPVLNLFLFIHKYDALVASGNHLISRSGLARYGITADVIKHFTECVCMCVCLCIRACTGCRAKLRAV